MNTTARTTIPSTSDSIVNGPCIIRSWKKLAGYMMKTRNRRASFDAYLYFDTDTRLNERCWNVAIWRRTRANRCDGLPLSFPPSRIIRRIDLYSICSKSKLPRIRLRPRPCDRPPKTIPKLKLRDHVQTNLNIVDSGKSTRCPRWIF